MEVQLDYNKRWFYRIVSTKNGQTVLTSQTYYSKFNARRAGKKFAAVNHLNYKEVN